MVIKRILTVFLWAAVLAGGGAWAYWTFFVSAASVPVTVTLSPAVIERTLLIRGRLQPEFETEVSTPIAGRIVGKVPSVGQQLESNRKLMRLRAGPEFVSKVNETVAIYREADRELKRAGRLAVRPNIRGTVKQLRVTSGQKVRAGDTLLTVTAAQGELIKVPAPQTARVQKILVEPGGRISPGDVLPMMYLAPLEVQVGSNGWVGGGDVIRRYLRASYAVEELEFQAGRKFRDSPLPVEQVFVTAPVAGVVNWCSPGLKTGTLLTKDQLLLKIASQDRLVACKVHEVDYPLIVPGQEIRIRFDAYPDLDFNGRLLEKEYTPSRSVFDQYSEYVVRFALLEDDSRLADGMNANLWITLSRKDDAPSLPLSTLLRAKENTYVAVLTEQGAVRVPVTLGMVGKDRVEVVGGLNGRERVVLYPERLSPLPPLRGEKAPKPR